MTDKTNETKVQTISSMQFASLIRGSYQTYKLKVTEYDYLILQFEKMVMDENEEDLEDEQRRKEMRPVINELMNVIKIDRNLTQLMLQDIKVIDSKGETAFTERFANRFTNVTKEINECASKIKELFAKITDLHPGFLENQVKVKLYDVEPKIFDLKV